MIETTLNKQQADALFAEHAVMMYGYDAVFDYKIAELFGQECCAWAESCMKLEGYLKGGKIWDELWAARSAYLAALEAEDERKAAERKAKRAAARKAKLEAQKAAESGVEVAGHEA